MSGYFPYLQLPVFYSSTSYQCVSAVPSVWCKRLTRLRWSRRTRNAANQSTDDQCCHCSHSAIGLSAVEHQINKIIYIIIIVECRCYKALSTWVETDSALQCLELQKTDKSQKLCEKLKQNESFWCVGRDLVPNTRTAYRKSVLHKLHPCPHDKRYVSCRALINHTLKYNYNNSYFQFLFNWPTVF